MIQGQATAQAGRAGVVLLAPAKLNLTLEVLGKRQDGFHEVRSVLQEIELWDSVSLELKPRGLNFRCSPPHLESQENSVLRAVDLLRQSTQKTCPVRSVRERTMRADSDTLFREQGRRAGGLSIRLQKGIPEAAGLGGHSSDAAATLRGLDWLWGTNLAREELSSLASQIGSDTPFFLIGGTALAEGRGEKLTPLSPLPPHWVVLLKPNIPTPHPKTARLYGFLETKHFSQGEHTAQLAAALKKPAAPEDILPLLHNTFELVAFQAFPGLAEYWQSFQRAGAPSVRLAGSGPALFTLTPDRVKASQIYKKLQRQGHEVYLARTPGTRD